MTRALITEESLSNIGNAIRNKLGVQTTYKPSEMAGAISSIPVAELGTKSITANGTYNASSDNVDGYSSVSVNVANSYTAQDEGKVVSSGALVAQTARESEITSNGTYDTTLNDEVTVDVSGGNKGIWLPLYAEYNESTISSSGWVSTDGTMSLLTDVGTYEMSDGKLVGGTSVRYTIPVNSSYIAVELVAELDSDFTPASNSNWYRQSCLLGCELSGAQKDFGLTLVEYNSKIYPSIGYNNASYLRGTIPVGVSEEHTYIFIVRPDMHMFLYVDGVLSAEVSANNSGIAINKLGILSNAEEVSSTGVKGRVSSIKVYKTDVYEF